MSPVSKSLKGVEKAAMFMMVINQENAAKIMQMLVDDEIKEISQAMSNLGTVTAENIENLIDEFINQINESLSFIGNIQNTERFLRKILGKEKVDVILEDIRGPAGKNIWDKLGNISEEILANYLKNEYPQTTALILSRLKPEQASKVLTQFSQDFAFEVIKRMLMMDVVKEEVLERVEKTLRSEFIRGFTKIQKHDNSQIIADIFNNFDRTNESKFMEMLEGFDIGMADKVKSLMFSFEDLKKLGPEDIQIVIKMIDKSKLALALKGASETIRNLFIQNMSQRAAKILIEELEGMGPVRLKDVDEAQSTIISAVKELINKGEIVIRASDEAEQFIY